MKSYLAAYLYGRGLMRFHQKRFEDAARLFKRTCDLGSAQERKELSYSYYGRSLLRIGKRKEALEVLSKAYEQFGERMQGFENEFERTEFLNFIMDYLKALNEAGEVERARQIKSCIQNLEQKLRPQGIRPQHETRR